MLRLVTMTTKFPHPLTAAYGRAYVCKIAMVLDAADRAPHWKAINDWMQSGTLVRCILTFVYNCLYSFNLFQFLITLNLSLLSLNSPSFIMFILFMYAEVSVAKISFLKLYVQVECEQVWPALEWVIQCVSYGAHSKGDLAPLWEYCYQEDKKDFLLCSFINALPLKYLLSHVIDVCQMVVSGKVSAVVLEAFGSRLLQGEICEQDTSVILRSVWKVVSRFPLCEYMMCVATWSRFASCYFTVIELSTIADHIVKRLASEMDHDAYLAQLVLVVKNMVEFRGEDLCDLLKLESFINILDWLREDPHASHVARSILIAVIRVFRIGGLKDFTIANQIVDQCARLFLSLRSDSLADEAGYVRSTCRLVASALDRPLLSLNLDRGLSWLVYARATLCQRNEIVTHIVTLMVSFSLQCSKEYSNSPEKASFMRACIANLFITIPSIQDPLVRFRMCMQTSCISLFINSLPQVLFKRIYHFYVFNSYRYFFFYSELYKNLIQTDALIRLCIETINILSVPPAQFVSICEQFLAFLVFVPDSPQKSTLYMFSAFVNAIERRQYDCSVLGEIWILCLRYLWAVSRPEFSVKYRNVQSNDVLYGSSAEYISHVSEKVDYIMNKILCIAEAEPASNPTISFLLLEYIVSCIEINESIIKLVSSLLKKCAQSGVSVNRLQYIVHDLTLLSDNNQISRNILQKMNIL
uniref:DUF3730 domain-containing protein n=1 Tax=Heterorhabditis bacteriophora TaxID=37862 RepID=A0A1I7XTJ0_HETBA